MKKEAKAMRRRHGPSPVKWYQETTTPLESRDKNLGAEEMINKVSDSCKSKGVRNKWENMRAVPKTPSRTSTSSSENG